MAVRVEILRKRTTGDLPSESLSAEWGVGAVEVRDVYRIGGLGPVEVRRLVEALVVDPVVETYVIDPEIDPRAVDVAFKAGVTDSVAEALIDGARMLGASGVVDFVDVADLANLKAWTGRRYLFGADVSPEALTALAQSHLYNPVIQRFAVGALLGPPVIADLSPRGRAASIPVTALNDPALLALSAQRRLSLDLKEMQAIQGHFAGLGREPTDVELEMLAQTWSEHCVHKTFRALIDYTERRADGTVDLDASGLVDGLLDRYIRAATEAVAKPWVRSAFVDDAGIIDFDDQLQLAFKVETHNHPSALEPFGGSNTGVGGVIRDIMGVSARPIAVTDVLCFGPRELPAADLPGGVLHPARIADGVVAGVENYGNTMGIPTVNGAVIYHPGYVANPLVYVGCLGVLPVGSHPPTVGVAASEGDLIVVVGGLTGRDGLRGATFSSMGMDADTGEASGGAVQIGHPIHQKQALEVIMAARDAGLYTAITDCGAGGLSSAVGEMARELGADVELTRVPLKYEGLEPWEIWLSEAQERMVLAVPPRHEGAMMALAERHAISCSVIGAFRGDGLLRITHGDDVVAQLDIGFVHGGIPRRQMVATFTVPEAEVMTTSGGDPGGATIIETLLALLAEPTIASKESIVRRFDHEVQGGTVVKPIVGVNGDGPSDAAVLVPLAAHRRAGPTGATRGCALSVAINPELGLRDPYAMAWGVVDEAFRNVVAVGADPDRVALLDNFCWGDPQRPEQLGALVRCAKGCHDAAVALGAPFISGKDSLNNEWRDAAGVSHPIPPTLLISAVAIVPDVTRTVTSDFKAAGQGVYLIGATDSNIIPPPNASALVTFRAVHQAILAGYIAACHDLSDGGLLVALAEMCIGGAIGAEIDLGLVEPTLTSTQAAFSETPTRFLVEVVLGHDPAFQDLFDAASVPCSRVGVVGAPDAVNQLTLKRIGAANVETLAAAFKGAGPRTGA